MFAYHYYAMARQHGQEFLIDGILTMKEKIVTMEHYRDAKEVIRNDVFSDTATITIKSLSFIGEN